MRDNLKKQYIRRLNLYLEAKFFLGGRNVNFKSPHLLQGWRFFFFFFFLKYYTDFKGGCYDYNLNVKKLG